MRIMLDTNILISAIVFDGKIEKLLNSLRDKGHQLFVSDYVEKEFKAKVNKKWPGNAEAYDKVYKKFLFTRCESTTKIWGSVRDKKDIPVLSDAIFNDVDILLTGDKDFFELKIKKPFIMSPTLMIKYLQN